MSQQVNVAVVQAHKVDKLESSHTLHECQMKDSIVAELMSKNHLQVLKPWQMLHNRLSKSANCASS